MTRLLATSGTILLSLCLVAMAGWGTLRPGCGGRLRKNGRGARYPWWQEYARRRILLALFAVLLVRWLTIPPSSAFAVPGLVH